MAWWRKDKNDLLLDVFVQPRASRNRVVGLYGERLKISVTAAPVDGGANREVVHFVAGLFGVGRSSVCIEQGQSSRRKRLRVKAVDELPASLASAASG